MFTLLRYLYVLANVHSHTLIFLSPLIISSYSYPQTLGPANLFFVLYKFAFSRMSCKWKHPTYNHLSVNSFIYLNNLRCIPIVLLQQFVSFYCLVVLYDTNVHYMCFLDQCLCSIFEYRYIFYIILNIKQSFKKIVGC